MLHLVRTRLGWQPSLRCGAFGAELRSAFMGLSRATYHRGLAYRVCRGLGRGHGPSGGRAQHGRDFLPSNLCSTVRRRDAGQPSEPPRRAAESNSLHATCNGFRQDTNNPLPTRTQEPAFLAQQQPLGLAVAGQSRFQWKPAH